MSELQAGTASIERNLDGSTTEYFEMAPSEEKLTQFLKEVFEDHWERIVFGPCIQGAVFEGRFFEKPEYGYLDGYVTIEAEGSQSWHFHLCVGPHAGTKAMPTPPELARQRRCSRAAFYRDLTEKKGCGRSWGFRMWNGNGEQMMTIFFPNPYLDPKHHRVVRTPDWSRLDLWMSMRAKYAGFPIELPPVNQEAPIFH